MRDRAIDRRELFKGGILAAVSAAAFGRTVMAAEADPSRAPSADAPKSRMKLGMVTYNFASDWDIPTIIRSCKAAKLDGVELRTTHKHGVEPSLSADKRMEVKKQFTDSGIRLWGLGSVCEFHSPEAAKVTENVEICKQFCELARDVGAAGVKVRPNGLPKEVPVEKTLEQIGKALRQCGQAADANGVEIWLEVHGSGSSHPPHIKKMMEHCGHPKVGVCWNSNSTDVKDGSIREYFTLLRPHILSCHITELTSGYPWRELFTLFRQTGYDRFTLAEILPLKSKDTGDQVRFLQFYRALWQELGR
jgi:sugar phosphate isomerase/epimerase